MKPLIIALCGPIGSGKTTIADVLVNLIDWRCNNIAGASTVRRAFAAPMKNMVCALLVSAGYNRQRIQDLLTTQEGKATVIPELGGKTIRHLLQTLGTEWGRDHVHHDLWASICIGDALRRLAAGGSTIIEDCRFANEAQAVRDTGGYVINLFRPVPFGESKAEVIDLAVSGHISENGIPDRLVHFTTTNDGDPRDVGEAILDRIIRMQEVSHG